MKHNIKELLTGGLIGIAISTIYYNFDRLRKQGNYSDLIIGICLGLALGGIVVLSSGCADLSIKKMELMDRCELNYDLCQNDIAKNKSTQNQCEQENFKCHDKIDAALPN